MMNEFPEIFNELFANSIKRLMKELRVKSDAIKQCEHSQKDEPKSPSRAQKKQSEDGVFLNDEMSQSERLREYKEKNMKRTLTKSDVEKGPFNVAKNMQTLKQIDEELEANSSSSGTLQEAIIEVQEDQEEDTDCKNQSGRPLLNGNQAAEYLSMKTPSSEKMRCPESPEKIGTLSFTPMQVLPEPNEPNFMPANSNMTTENNNVYFNDETNNEF